jgi:hypothetical protein
LQQLAAECVENGLFSEIGTIHRMSQGGESTGFSAKTRTGYPEWGSGGRWFESSRPDIARARQDFEFWRASSFRLETALQETLQETRHFSVDFETARHQSIASFEAGQITIHA